ncbi:MAG: hypothetical protein GXX84_06670 [Acidobacteria bacterium]|nr:hypothetical protein [Acidobacteriota bacterium]
MFARRSAGMILVLGAALLLSAQLEAADFTFFLGGVFPESIEHNDVETPLDASPVYGFRLSNSIVPMFAMEHTLGFSSDYLFPGSGSAVSEAKGFVYNSNLVLNLPFRPFSAVPYLTAGAGLLHQYGSSDLPVGTRFAYNYGGGLKFPRIAGPLGLRFDLRGYSAGVFANNLNLLEFSGGLYLSLGGF